MSTGLKLTRYVVASDVLSLRRTGSAHVMVFATRSGEVLVVDPRAWAAIEAGQIDALPGALRERLREAQILVPDDEDELAAVVADNQRAIEAHEVLYQVVQPTAWCQLDCHYCGQEHSGQQLDEVGQRAFLARVRERLATGRYRHLKLGWFGAEPLAGLAVIREMTAAARALAAEFGCTYSAQIVTNGVALTPAVAAELAAELQAEEAEITLDGLAEAHDRRRMTKGGRGSFERVFTNLRAVAAATDLRLKIRCNVDRTNVDGVAPLIQALADAGLAGRVTFYTSPVYAWGNDAHQGALEKEEYAERELEWFALQLRLGFQVGLIPPRRRVVCLSVQRDGEVVDAFGATFNCTEAPYVPAYGSPNLYQIRLPVGRDAEGAAGAPVDDAAARRLRGFNEQILAGEHRSCAQCRMLPVCGGHCPKAWLEGHEPCPSAKVNMRQRLNLLFAIHEIGTRA